jgi:hypothetical protein
VIRGRQPTVAAPVAKYIGAIGMKAYRLVAERMLVDPENLLT